MEIATTTEKNFVMPLKKNQNYRYVSSNHGCERLDFISLVLSLSSSDFFNHKKENKLLLFFLDCTVY